MKIRNGYVSNSSSSSFIVTLPKSIDNYTLEEFRELLNTDVKAFDPVEQLYNDLKDKENSQPKDWDKLHQKHYGIEYFKENQYIVNYGNECDETYGHGSEMEYDFMPYLTNDDVSVEVFSEH